MTRPLGGPGYPLVESALGAIERHRMLAGGETVVVAVSGGPDSACLLDVLARLSDRLGLTLHVAHVDHGLNDSSEEVAAGVTTRAAEAGYDAHVVRAPDLSGPNLQARAREFRYGFFGIVAEQVGAARIATGHTLDDRVETTMARLIHGGGTGALAGIKPVEGNRIRPLIESRRAETRAYCEEVGLVFHDDPANRDPRFERAAVRDRVIAVIEERWGEGAVRAMATSAARLLEDAGALDAVAGRLYADLAGDGEGAVSFPRPAFEGLPRAVRRRLLERAVGRVRDRSGGIDETLDALERGGQPGARFAVAGGGEIVVDKDSLRFTRGPD